MTFNKSKAMRSAERFLTQGKLHSAISEYKTIVENDPKDINTMNMLGDLYSKCSDNKSATNYYSQVAEHYHKQGFAKKAISIYNKIYRIDPESLEIAEKLAELYRSRGSLAEARRHYVEIAKRYEEKDLREKALEIWEIIGELDPQNSEIHLKIADYYWQDDQKENAAESFIEAALRLLDNNEYEAAVTSFSRALEVLPDNLVAVNGFVKCQLQLGYPEEAAKTLEELAEKEPHNKEIAYLLIDCYFDLDKPAKAEEVIIQIVEREPANYEKLIDLINIYLEKDDLESTVRILEMVSEHLLSEGKNEELKSYTDEVLARNPEQIQALRLQARYYGWLKDELELQKTLERLAETSRTLESVEDERLALAQLNLLVPHNATYSERLKEINDLYGFSEETITQEFLIKDANEIPDFENYQELHGETDENTTAQEFNFETNGYEQNGFSESEVVDSKDNIEDEYAENVSEVENEFAENIEIDGFESHNTAVEKDFTAQDETPELTLSNEKEIEDEVESVKFYIEQGYVGLAEKSLDSLESKFGKQTIFAELRERITGNPNQNFDETEYVASAEVVEITANSIVSEVIEEQDLSNENVSVNDEFLENEDKPKVIESAANNDFEDFRDDLDLEEKTESKDDDDYENHYHYAVAYQEMGLLEDAIREFQDAANCVRVNDGTRRFYQCSNLLGHCFMEKQMPHLALVWLEKALETNDLSEAEEQGLQYEIANAYEANGEIDKARTYFEQVYAADVDYRDVAERVRNLEKQLIAQ